jgi:hypothetical protein
MGILACDFNCGTTLALHHTCIAILYWCPRRGLVKKLVADKVDYELDHFLDYNPSVMFVKFWMVLACLTNSTELLFDDIKVISEKFFIFDYLPFVSTNSEEARRQKSQLWRVAGGKKKWESYLISLCNFVGAAIRNNKHNYSDPSLNVPIIGFGTIVSNFLVVVIKAAILGELVVFTDHPQAFLEAGGRHKKRYLDPALMKPQYSALLTFIRAILEKTRNTNTNIDKYQLATDIRLYQDRYRDLFLSHLLHNNAFESLIKGYREYSGHVERR